MGSFIPRSRHRLALAWLSIAALVAACSGADAPLIGGSAEEAGAAPTDTPSNGPLDAGGPRDGDAPTDGGAGVDARAVDASVVDATAVDASAVDASAVDATTDSSSAGPDAQSADADADADADGAVDAMPDALIDAGGDAALPACDVAAWTSVVVDAPVRLDYDGPAIAGGEATRRIAIADNRSSRLRMANLAPSGWSTESVDAGVLPMHVAHVVDATGASNVALYDFSAGERFVEGTPGGFTATALSALGATAGTAFYRGTDGVRTMAIDAAGATHVLALNANGGLYQATRPKAGAWSVTALADNITQVWAGLAADGTTLHAVYINTYVSAQYFTIVYASRAANAGWSAKALTGGGTQPSIAVDAKHGVHVSYVATPSADLVHAHRPAGGVWSFETVDSVGSVGWNSRIAVDPAGAVHVVYDDLLNGLKEAVRDPVSGKWTVTVVDGGGAKGDVVVDADGTTSVAYYAAAENAVRWATRPPCR